jgi:hypothetical protein
MRWESPVTDRPTRNLDRTRVVSGGNSPSLCEDDDYDHSNAFYDFTYLGFSAFLHQLSTSPSQDSRSQQTCKCKISWGRRISFFRPSVMDILCSGKRNDMKRKKKQGRNPFAMRRPMLMYRLREIKKGKPPSRTPCKMKHEILLACRRNHHNRRRTTGETRKERERKCQPTTPRPICKLSHHSDRLMRTWNIAEAKKEMREVKEARL